MLDEDHKCYRLSYLNCHAHQTQQLKLINNAAIMIWLHILKFSIGKGH